MIDVLREDIDARFVNEVVLLGDGYALSLDRDVLLMDAIAQGTCIDALMEDMDAL